MTRIPLMLIALLLACVLLPAGSADFQEEYRYTAGQGPMYLVCGSAEHPLVPQGDPTDHPLDVLTWLLSGEPECAGADAANHVREAKGEERVAHGVGAALWWWDEDVEGRWPTGETFAVRLVDDHVDEADTFIRLSVPTGDTTEPLAVEGCGPQSLVVPEYVRHWQWNGPRTGAFVAQIPGIEVMEDLRVCGSTTGRTQHAFIAPA